MKKKKTIKLSIIVLMVLISSFFALFLRLAQVALSKEVDGIDIAAFAKNRNTTTKKLYASRGTIYDVNGETLAQSVNSYTVIAYLSESRTKDINKPKHVVDKERTARELSPIINMSEEDILKILNKKTESGNDFYQVELGPGGRGISELTKQQIEKLELPGIGFLQSTKRYYKLGTLAPYIVGYAREDEDGKITGEMGIEAYFNDELEGEDGTSTYETDVYGYRLPNSTEKRIEPKEGQDIYLTIDSDIQRFLEEAVNKISSENEMSWLTFTIADAKTGAILGSASNPTFDLNKQNMTSYLDPLVSYKYEPGSTMKIYSFLASMENGQYKGDDKYLSGKINVGDAEIHDFNDVGWGTITYDEGFARSSNVAATKLALNLGKDKLMNFYESLGFGTKTGITLPGEVKGDLLFNVDTELATASYGQGITTTPIQNIQALTVIANDGIMLKPYIISKIVDRQSGKTIFTGEREEIRQIASKENVDYIRKLMDDAIYLKYTDALYYQPKNIRMIGKTGTANIPSNSGGYLKGKYDYIRSFAGLFPAEDPKYIVYISVKQFVGPIKTIASAVTSVVEDVANYKNIANIKVDESKEEIITLDNFINTETIEVEEKLKNLKLQAIVIGDGKYVLKQYPLKNKKVLSGNKVYLVTSNSNFNMPDMTSWSESDVVTFCNLINLKYAISGYGKVKSQSIEAKSLINLDDILQIELEN